MSFQVSAMGSGGDETDDTPDNVAGIKLCTSDPAAKTLNCNRWGLEWGLINETGGGEISNGEGGTVSVDLVTTFSTFAAALDCATGNAAGNGCSNSGDGWRLPNIKELARMFRYTAVPSEVGNTALADVAPRKWFDTLYFKGTGGEVVEFADGSNNIISGITPYILTATYRDLDMNDSNNHVQVLAINLNTGAIMAVDRGDDALKLCPVVNVSGTCLGMTTDRDLSETPIIVFKVKTI